MILFNILANDARSHKDHGISTLVGIAQSMASHGFDSSLGRIVATREVAPYDGSLHDNLLRILGETKTFPKIGEDRILTTSDVVMLIEADKTKALETPIKVPYVSDGHGRAMALLLGRVLGMSVPVKLTKTDTATIGLAEREAHNRRMAILGALRSRQCPADRMWSAAALAAEAKNESQLRPILGVGQAQQAMRLHLLISKHPQIKARLAASDRVYDKECLKAALDAPHGTPDDTLLALARGETTVKDRPWSLPAECIKVLRTSDHPAIIALRQCDTEASLLQWINTHCK